MRRLLSIGFLIWVWCLLVPGYASSPNLKQQLSAQHFSGILEGDVRFTSLGKITCGAKSLHAIYYEWYESSPPGKAIHSSHRVILMDRTTYIGSYAVEDKPSIQGDVIRFPYNANGNSISCGADGVVPQKALLDGEIILLEK
jgi:hypothetical protein